MTNILTTHNLGIDFGGLTAVNDLDLEVNSGEIIGLIGPNGAGKTTVFNLLTKVYEPSRGSIILKGQDITGLSTIEVSKAGIARTFQNIRLFSKMSVIDNIVVAMHNNINYSLFDSLFKTPKYHKSEKEIYHKAEELLAIFDMQKYKDNLSSSLPYGQQRKLEILRAMATNPSLLLLDEPAAGMNPSETAELMKTIHDIKEQFNIAILLIEHDMSLVMGICERIYVINFGMLLAKGTADEVKNNPEVIKAYLGD